MTIATRDAFLQSAKRRYTDVDIPGFGTVRIQSLTAGEVAEIEAGGYTSDKAERAKQVAQWQARYICKAVVDEQHNRHFADNEIEHVQRMDAAITTPLYEAIHAHCNSMSVEDAEKN